MNNVIRLVGRRLVALPLMILGVVFLVFFLMSFSKIDPAYSALGENSTEAQREAFRISQGLDKPWLIQFLAFLGGMFRGSLGVYGVRQDSVAELVGQAFPITMQLTFFGLLIAIVVAFPLGVLAALYRDRWPDKVIRVLSIAGIATPSFWLGILLIVWMGPGGANILPVSGRLPAMTDNFGGWFLRMLLPAVALAVPVIGSLTRVIRTSMVEELDSDYVRTALGAGIPKTVVVARNVLRNALITPVTVLGLRVGYLMGGAVVIEVIFNLRGMGRVIVDGITNNWTSVVQGVVLVVAIAFIIVNIVVDLLYIAINPRIRSV
ncbi:peptide/nickel transport system permease protein [Actinobaculum suis]|uniref:ABC transporter permease n=1 Tax=Actinobaculum suis TaxID=1657 RepID=A0A0K9ETD5_9ACTO|nr:ABC transporter permease [Actinobaculum suis]KMY23140.1 ABC transporter permease [Actinobaculum suis]MDY5152777.1 ABC transporter permease [Actinobaculum suis]OCA94888.1 ABC transporter permease [Actinobaculum suis]OCA95476.1 ABC transporter permease [Actinobaculum suis]SDE44257.1 peptide/nickel transport system permease protein [Actinobaculum suis]